MKLQVVFSRASIRFSRCPSSKNERLSRYPYPHPFLCFIGGTKPILFVPEIWSDCRFNLLPLFVTCDGCQMASTRLRIRLCFMPCERPINCLVGTAVCGDKKCGAA